MSTYLSHWTNIPFHALKLLAISLSWVSSRGLALTSGLMAQPKLLGPNAESLEGLARNWNETSHSTLADLFKKAKSTTWAFWVSHLGQREDCSPGDSISDSSEKLLQRCREEGKHNVILVKGEYMQSRTYFLQKVSASHMEQLSPGRTLVLF